MRAPHLLLASLFLLFPSLTASAQFDMELIGAPAPWTGGAGADVNSRGDVVGFSEEFAYGWTGWLWTESAGMSRLPLRNAAAINDYGDVVGTTEASDAMLIRSDGTQVALGTLGRGGQPMAVNDESVVVGWSFNGTAVRPFMWSPTTGMIDIGVGAGEGIAHDVNDSGTVVLQTGQIGYIRSPDGSVRALSSPGNSNAFALAISDRGEAAGAYQVPVRSSAAFWSADGTLHVLESLRDADWCVATDINNTGAIVGYCFRSSPFANFSFAMLSDGQLLWFDDGLAAISDSGIVAGTHRLVLPGSGSDIPMRLHLPEPVGCDQHLLSLQQRIDTAVLEGGLATHDATPLYGLVKGASHAFCGKASGAEQVLSLLRERVVALDDAAILSANRASILREIDRVLGGGGPPEVK